ncbi:MAG: vWA domain-containing protein [Myxococcota bacterium]
MNVVHARSAAAALAGLLAAGCQNYLFEQKCPEAVREARETLVLEQPVPVDILFVIDNSCSMADEQENLVRNFDAFIGVLAGSNLDFRIAVVTTDIGGTLINLNAQEQAGQVGFRVDTSSPLRPVDSRDRSGCRELSDTEHGCFRSGRAERWIESGRDAAASIPGLFADAARVGTCGSGNERGTSAMAVALDNTASGECNTGFIRDDANLVVIVVSDEDDFDPISTSDLLNRVEARKPLERVRFAVIGGFVDGLPSTCGTRADGSVTAMCGSLCEMQRPPANSQGRCPFDGCSFGFACDPDTNECVALDYANFPNENSGVGCDACSSFDVDDCCAADIGATRYLAFATALEDALAQRDPVVARSGCQGSGMGRSVCLVDSICQGEFADTLQRIAQELVVANSITLDPPATNPDGIVVQLRGGRFQDTPRVLVAGTEYVIDYTGVRLDIISAEVLPQASEELEVFFTVDTTVDGSRVGICQ